MSSLIAGFLLSLSLILAIGAQNAFVLRQGLKRQHLFAVCMFCGVSDAILIGLGVFASGEIASSAPWFAKLMRYGGAVFLIWYGWRNAVSAWRGEAAQDLGDAVQNSLGKTLGTLAALTWLNPHVYLDTVVLIGSVSAQYDDRMLFGTGAVSASFVFFFALGYGARLFAPVLQSPRAWQILDACIAVTMWAIALGLLLG